MLSAAADISAVELLTSSSGLWTKTPRVISPTVIRCNVLIWFSRRNELQIKGDGGRGGYREIGGKVKTKYNSKAEAMKERTGWRTDRQSAREREGGGEWRTIMNKYSARRENIWNFHMPSRNQTRLHWVFRLMCKDQKYWLFCTQTKLHYGEIYLSKSIAPTPSELAVSCHALNGNQLSIKTSVHLPDMASYLHVYQQRLSSPFSLSLSSYVAINMFTSNGTLSLSLQRPSVAVSSWNMVWRGNSRQESTAIKKQRKDDDSICF